MSVSLNLRQTFTYTTCESLIRLLRARKTVQVYHNVHSSIGGPFADVAEVFNGIVPGIIFIIVNQFFMQPESDRNLDISLVLLLSR